MPHGTHRNQQPRRIMEAYTMKNFSESMEPALQSAREHGYALLAEEDGRDYALLDFSAHTPDEARRFLEQAFARHQLERLWSRNAGSPITQENIESEVAATRNRRRNKYV